MLKDLILKNRSYRRFYQDQNIELETLKELVDLARLSASARNLQPLKFLLSCDSQKNSLIFPNLSWADRPPGQGGPFEGEKPAAYIIILGDRDITQNFRIDHGIAAQSILLGAVEKGLGGCMIGAIQREALRQALNIPARYEILLVIALGKPKQKVSLETVEANGHTQFWVDEQEVQHVPKRKLEDLIME
jgi:nitroreductase